MFEYNKFDFGYDQVIIIELGLKKGLDVSKYANTNLSHQQMIEIMDGLMNGIDVDLFNKPEFDPMQMREIKLGIENGIDAKLYADPKFNAGQMAELRTCIENGVDKELINTMIEAEYNPIVIYLLGISNQTGFDLLPYVDGETDGLKLSEIFNHMILDLPEFDFEEFTGEQIREINIGLLEGFDVSLFSSPEFDPAQMRMIRVGMEAGFDPTSYAKPFYTAEEMNAKFNALMQKSYEEAMAKEALEEQRNADEYVNGLETVEG